MSKSHTSVPGSRGMTGAVVARMLAVVVTLATMVGVFLVLGPLDMTRSGNTTGWELDPAEAGYYRLKKANKPPKLKRRPSNWFYEQRAYPHGEILQQQYVQALDEARTDRRNFKAAGITAVTWDPAGPTNIPGRITDIAVQETDLNTIYAASAAGGIYKSTDLGGSWTAIFDNVGTFGMGAVAIDQTDASIIYAGTGEGNGAIDNYEGTGIYKSADAGMTWTHLGLDSTAAIGRIVVDSANPSTIFVAAVGKVFGTPNSYRGLYRSLDGGADWEQVLYVDDSTGCSDVALHPSTGVLFAAMWQVHEGPGSALYRSVDGGDTWTMIQGTGGLPAPGDIGRIGVTVDPQSSTVYTLQIDGSTRDLLGLYKSTDLGVNWTQVNDSPIDGTFGGFGWYFGQVRVVPGEPDVVFSLGVSLWRSVDGGSSWENVTGATHVDHHAMFIPTSAPNRVYSGCDGGVNYSDNLGASWTVFRNMANTQFYAGTMDYNNPERLYGGTQDNGTLRTLTGSTGDWTMVFGGDGFQSIVDYTNPDVFYCESQFGNLVKSVDGGATFIWAQNGIDPSGTEPHAWNTPV
ncbi:hypothetical protein GF377_00040, partial [candidate division GN15 bacterium]|nr:hypothetical protein [candidate division GN15 bacterium]